MSDVATVRRIVPFQLVLPDESVQPVACELRFEAADPYTVKALFGGGTSVWLLGRELLAQGLLADMTCPAGYGDVKVWRDESPEYLLLSLSGVEGEALLAAEADVVDDFLNRTTDLVPFGAEGHLMERALDTMITALLGA